MKKKTPEKEVKKNRKAKHERACGQTAAAWLLLRANEVPADDLP